MKNQNFEIEGMRFEKLLGRAFRFDSRIKRPHKREFLNLIDAEKGMTSKGVGSKEIQLKGIKKKIKKSNSDPCKKKIK